MSKIQPVIQNSITQHQKIYALDKTQAEALSAGLTPVSDARWYIEMINYVTRGKTDKEISDRFKKYAEMQRNKIHKECDAYTEPYRGGCLNALRKWE